MDGMRKEGGWMMAREASDREDEIDLREILRTLSHYRRSILAIVILSGIIAAFMAYFRPSVYKAESLLKITMQKQGYYEDFLMTAPDASNSEVEDELIVFRSRPIIERALKKLDIGTRYFTQRRFRTVELYLQSPFRVKYTALDPELYGAPFEVIPVDSEHFRLVYTPKSEWLGGLFETDSIPLWSYDRTHRYGERIKTEKFEMTVTRVDSMEDPSYTFTIVPNEMMTEFVKGGIDAVTTSKYGSVVSLSFEDTVPWRAAQIVNGIAQAYIEKNLELKSESAKQQLYFIDMQLDAINKTLQGSANKLQRYKAMHVVVDLSSKAQMTAKKLSDLESSLYGLKLRIRNLEDMRTTLSKEKGDTLLGIAVEKDTPLAITSLVERIREVQAQYATLSVNYTERHPGVRKLKKELDFLKHSLRKALAAQIASLKKQERTLLESIEEERKQLKSVPMQEQQLEQLTRHFMVNEKIYSYLLEKRAETAILASSTISNTRVIEEAEVPFYPIKPKRKLIVLVGLILGMILGVAQAFFREYLDNTVKMPDEIETLTHIPVYGTLPLVRSKREGAAYDEAIRSLWINLAFLEHSKQCRVISVTSTVSGEGKTFSAYNLGRMIAKSSDHRVVVIDMDMRKPMLHTYFGEQNGVDGVSTYLSGDRKIDEIIMRTQQSNLDFIPAGPIAPNPTRLIMSETFDRMVAELSERYHYIVIDTSPVGIVSDAMNVMYHSDLVLFMLKANMSKKAFIDNINRFSIKEAINLGIVLNGVDFEHSRYYSGYYGKEAEQYRLESEGHSSPA